MDDQRKQDRVSGFALANPEQTRKQAILIAAAVFASRERRRCQRHRQGKFLVEEIDR